MWLKRKRNKVQCYRCGKKYERERMMFKVDNILPTCAMILYICPNCLRDDGK